MTSFAHTHSWTIPATPDRVFRALVEPAALMSWFAEHAAIEPRAEGGYRFWGRHTLGSPDESSARQRITRYEPDTALAFTWPLLGADTNVAMTLAPAEGGTKLSLTHEVAGDLATPRQKELVDDHWRLAIGNLQEHLAGKAPVLPDFADPNPEVRMTITIDAPPSTVFRALTEPARIDRWFGGKSSVVEPRAGGRYQLNWEYKVNGADVIGGPTKVLEIVPDEKLVLDWPDWRGDMSVSTQTISFTLAPLDGGRTLLTFVHAGFGRTADISDYGFGWKWFLEQLTKESTT